HHHRVGLEADAAEVVEDAAVVDAAVLRGAAMEGEAGAVEELGEEVGEAHLALVHAGGDGQGVELAVGALGDEGGEAGVGLLDLAEEPLALGEGGADADAEEDALGDGADLVAEELAVLPAHLLGGAVEEE